MNHFKIYLVSVETLALLIIKYYASVIENNSKVTSQEIFEMFNVDYETIRYFKYSKNQLTNRMKQLFLEDNQRPRNVQDVTIKKYLYFRMGNVTSHTHTHTDYDFFSMVDNHIRNRQFTHKAEIKTGMHRFFFFSLHAKDDVLQRKKEKQEKTLYLVAKTIILTSKTFLLMQNFCECFLIFI